MSGQPDPVWERIAAALERIAPGPQARTDWLTAPAFVWDAKRPLALDELAAEPLGRLCGIEAQKVALRDNCMRIAQGSGAHDMLLWGARGMGKSALVRSVVADVQSEMPGAIALVQVAKDSLASLAALLPELTEQPRAFILFCDDLSFDEGSGTDDLALRSLLDGSVIKRPAQIRFAVTSNRRGLSKQTASDDPATMHARDERDNFLALSDRFGLSLGFHPCSQSTYLEIVRAYLGPVGVAFSEKDAAAWAIARGNRSGRTAYQFAVEMAGRSGKQL